MRAALSWVIRQASLWCIETIRRAGSVNYSSEVMPWWHPWGWDPVLVLGQGVPHFPLLLQARAATAGCSWGWQVFCLHVREKFKSQTISHQEEMLSLPSMPAKHVFDLLQNIKYIPSITNTRLYFTRFLDLTGEIPY